MNSALPRLLIFTSNSCPNCKTLKEYLTERGLKEKTVDQDGDYTVLNISDNPAHRKLLMSKAIMQVPAMIFDNEKKVVGFQKDEVDEIINSIIGQIVY